MFGYPCELDELRAICERHGLTLIEDAAEALGAEYKGAPIGSHGPSGVFGFYPNKQLATGEGGVVFTHDEREWQLVRSLRNQGRDYEGGAWFNHVRLGWNYRWTDVQAAIGIGAAREARPAPGAAGRGGRALRAAARRRRRRAALRRRRRAPPLVVRLRGRAAARGRPRPRDDASCARRGSAPPSTCRASTCSRTCARRTASRRASCPVAEEFASRSLALPFYPQLEAEDQERVVEVLRGAL